MSTPPRLTAADIRAAIAARRILKYEVAHRVGMHPQRLSALLNERAPLTPELAQWIIAALEVDDAQRGR